MGERYFCGLKDNSVQVQPCSLICLQYIVKHDAAKKIEQIDYKNLPQKTKKQKKYYRQAENRAKRKSINNVLNIFAELEA